MNLKPFVNNKDLWDAFCEEIDRRIALRHKELEQLEGNDLYRKQGSVQELKKLRQLREYVNGQDA